MGRTQRSAWDAAMSIIEALRAWGHNALLAGGCVRDRLLGLTPKDFDVVTDAHPERVQTLFPRARLVGAKFGVVIVRRYGFEIEVATFRSDGTYSDGRRPDEVTYGTAEEDARRRDFTINGVFLDPIADRVIDYVGGVADLQKGVLRTIGDPDRRFAEDHLRMLRAIRFAGRLRLTIDSETFGAIERNAPRLRDISPERIWMELALILEDPSRAAAWDLIVRSGLSRALTESWPWSSTEGESTARRLASLSEAHVAAELGLAALLAGESAAGATTVCRGLRLSNRSQDMTLWLIRSLPVIRAADALELADLKVLMAGPAWDELLTLLHAELIADGAPLDPYERAQARAAAIAPDQVTPPPLVTGNDLSAMGMTPGPAMGTLLHRLYREQLNESLGSHEEAITRARVLLAEERSQPDDTGR